MSRLKLPYDKDSAKGVMKKFSDLAYATSHINIFQEAVSIIYGKEFHVTVDLSKRMQFSCQICNREMNSENAMAEHYRSGSHQKNLDKRNRDAGEPNYPSRAHSYASDSIQFKLLNSQVAPVGLQMVEEYINRKGNVYFKCMLCGAHGKLDTMYHHIIGKKHTEKYIKSGCVLESSIITSNEREEIRARLIDVEGINVNAIKTFKGNDYYPHKWEKESSATRAFNMVKRELKSESRSPSPGPSRSTTSRRRSRSPSRRRSRSPSRRRSRSPSRRHSKLSSRRLSRSPPKRRSRSLSRSPRNKRSQRKDRSESSSSSGSSVKDHSLHKKGFVPSTNFIKTDINSLRAPSVARDVGDLSAFRNSSPPPFVPKSEPVSCLPLAPAIQIKAEPLSTEHNSSLAPAIQIKAEPMSPVHNSESDIGVLLPMLHPSNIKKEKEDKSVQTKVDVDDLMKKLNYVVKSHPGTEYDIKNTDDVKDTIDLMGSVANVLRELTVKTLEDGTCKSREMKNQLVIQKEKREKIIGYITKWFKPTWEAERSREQLLKKE